jgi:hypothetical protein
MSVFAVVRPWLSYLFRQTDMHLENAGSTRAYGIGTYIQAICPILGPDV